MNFIPMGRDELIAALREDRGDLAAGMLTVTPASWRDTPAD